MSKRELQEQTDDRPPKRSRPAKPAVQPDRPVEEIYSARQLQDLLLFRQDDIPQLRHGIASCKAFLDDIVHHAENDGHDRRLLLLKEYLESEKPRDANDTDRPFFHQLWQAWSFANSSNNDHLSSAVCSHFALLLKSLSTLLDFAEYGKMLCRTVLQYQHLRLIKRCLDAPKHKEFLLSPSLRFLTELLNFDGGVFAREVYKRREQTFDFSTLRKCLTLTKSERSEEDMRRRPAVRTLAVRYVMAHLRLQDEGGRIDILRQRSLCSTLFSYFRNDPAELILHVLKTVETHVFKNDELPRASKSSLLTQQHLERVVDIATRSEINEDVTTEAMRWLNTACSTPSYGILRSSGWYPPGTTSIDTRTTFDHGAIDLGLQSLSFWENEEKYQLRNTVLSSWLLTLHPNSDTRERDLVLTCFKAAPELVHAYYRENTLQMDPKLTNTWIGYASYLFEVVSLPLPDYVGNMDSTYAALPPQTSIVMSSIMPEPLTQKVLSRCLNQNEKLISFFVVRLLVVAVEKIDKLRREHRQAAEQSQHPDLWDEASKQLENAYMQTFPPVKDIMTLFRRLPDDVEHGLQREATSRLIRLYLTVLPQSIDDNIDVSSALMTALARQHDQTTKTSSWHNLELENLILIAQRSTDVRWFQRQRGLNTSPFTAMLKICVEGTTKQVEVLTKDILCSNDILLDSLESDQPSSFDALLWSLQANSHDAVWEFLEQCLVRVTKAPVKYLDDLDNVLEDNRVGLLMAVIWEQSPFIMSKSELEMQEVMRWTNCFFSYMLQSSLDESKIRAIKAKIDSIDGWNAVSGSVTEQKSLQGGGTEDRLASPAISDTKDALSIFSSPPMESADHPELFRWRKKDLDIAFEEHDIDALVLCLCSDYSEVRRQARSQLGNLVSKLQSSDVAEKDQLYLVLGELLETYDQNYREGDLRLPYLVGTFASHAFQVEMEPAHCAYPKLNRFLMKSPDWRVNKLSSYWLVATSLDVPCEDDSYWKEVQWVLIWLVDGLRTQADLEILRRSGSFERLMTLYASPAASEKLVKQRVLEIVYRASLIDAVTLVTRTGVLSWLQMLRGDLPVALRRSILSRSDVDRVQKWSGSEL